MKVLKYLYQSFIVDTFTPLFKEMRHTFSGAFAQEEIDRMEKTRIYMVEREKNQQSNS